MLIMVKEKNKEVQFIGDLMRKYRKDNNLRQIDLANRVKCSKNAISSFENGDYYPDLKTAIRLSDWGVFNLNDLVIIDDFID